MIFVYNFLQLILLPMALVMLLIQFFGRKNMSRTLQRLAVSGLPSQLTSTGQPVLWIHCLSVGELTSALPLIRAIRTRFPDGHITLSVSTRSGMAVARVQATPYINQLIYSPFDLLPAIKRYFYLIRPQLFILVETDFWPNWLYAIRRGTVPSMLVNGRISRASYKNYQRFRFFFAPMFNTFSILAMQTRADALQMQKLGISTDQIRVLGNLKYAAAQVNGPADTPNRSWFNLPDSGPVWVCGSTHPGEEERLLNAFSRLRNRFQDLSMVIAPRDPNRGSKVAETAKNLGLEAETALRSAGQKKITPLLILDTLGELADVYSLARIAFIGGSLVARGGHNPLEASACGVPVLFGPHMEDFQEIARDLIDCGGGRSVATLHDIEEQVDTILCDNNIHEKMSSAALNLVDQNKEVLQHHVDLIVDLLPSPAN